MTRGLTVILPNRMIKSIEVNRLHTGESTKEALKFIIGSHTEVEFLKLIHFGEDQMNETCFTFDANHKNCKLWSKLLHSAHIRSIELEDVECPNLKLYVPSSVYKIHLKRVNLNTLTSVDGQSLKDISIASVTGKSDPIFTKDCQPHYLTLVDVNIIPYLSLITHQLVHFKLMFLTDPQLDLDFRNLATLQHLEIVGCRFRNLQVPPNYLNHNTLGDLAHHFD